ncbi:hypothetical protein JHK86_023984 [Glycine max]|nr:hypothetical protein JHK86_023984 [Glycine max]
MEGTLGGMRMRRNLQMAKASARTSNGHQNAIGRSSQQIQSERENCLGRVSRSFRGVSIVLLRTMGDHLLLVKSSQYLEETIEDDRGGKDNEVIVIGEKVTKLTRKLTNCGIGPPPSCTVPSNIQKTKTINSQLPPAQNASRSLETSEDWAWPLISQHAASKH